MLNAGAVIDAHVFGDAFDGMMDVLDGWDTVRGTLKPTSLCLGWPSLCCGFMCVMHSAGLEGQCDVNCHKTRGWQRFDNIARLCQVIPAAVSGTPDAPQIFGFHTPCCYSGNNAYPEPASQECKVRRSSLPPASMSTLAAEQPISHIQPLDCPLRRG